MSSKLQKQSYRATDKNRADCPFSVTLLPAAASDQHPKAKKQRYDGPEDVTRPRLQAAPFAPVGRFKSRGSMDISYAVEPRNRWFGMTRYNSFVFKGTKYFTENYVYVANEATTKHQKVSVGRAMEYSNDYWVARILEIRATDELHVYARVFWMYSPDEIPSHTIDGRRMVAGRQPYHGKNELIASNHMDIINVVSVVMPATVNHWIEADDDQVQDALYWRQAFDCRTAQLSAVETMCRCEMPANPDQTLIGCTNDSCGKWLHSDCLLHDALMRTFNVLGKDKPHKTVSTSGKGKDENHTLHSLSPSEIKGETHTTISMGGGSSSSGSNMMVKPPVEREAFMTPRTTTTPMPESTNGNIGPKSTIKKRRRELFKSSKPYSGLFEATLKMDDGPTVWVIQDLRENVKGGDRTWMEPAHCLLCGSTVD